MSLREAVVGHARPLAALEAIGANDRVPNALAFVGPSGVGKRTTALAFFDALNGRPARAPGAPTASVDPDLVDVRALAATGRPESAQIDAVREVKRLLALAPVRPGGVRMVLIDDAEDLSPPAANALLKSVEEPPERTFFVLIASEAGRLLPTLRSRSTVIRFGPLSDEESIRVIAATGLPAAEARRIAALAPGRPGRALEVARGEGPGIRDALLKAAKARAPLEGPEKIDRAAALDGAVLAIEAARRRLAEEACGDARGALRALEAALEAAEAISRGGYAPLVLDAAAIQMAP